MINPQSRLQIVAAVFLLAPVALAVDPGTLCRNTIPQVKQLAPAWVESLTEQGHAVDTGLSGSNQDETLKNIDMPVRWIGCGTVYQIDPPWEKLVNAIKAGNPNAPVGFSQNIFPNLTPFSDLVVSDGAGREPEIPPAVLFEEGGQLEGQYAASWFYMDGWSSRVRNGKFSSKPKFSAERYIEFFKKADEAKMPITINLSMTPDVAADHPFFNPMCIDIMKQVRQNTYVVGMSRIKRGTITQRKGKDSTSLYLNAVDGPEDGKFTLFGVNNPVLKASLLATGDAIDMMMFTVPDRRPLLPGEITGPSDYQMYRKSGEGVMPARAVSLEVA